MKKEYIQNGESETGETREHNLNLCAKCIWIISTIVLHFNQMVWDRPHSNDYDSPILNDTAKNDTFLCCTPFSCFFFFKFCLLLVSDLDIEVFPYITTNFSVYLLLVLLSLPLSLLFISTTPAYILDKTLVLKTFQTLHNAL